MTDAMGERGTGEAAIECMPEFDFKLSPHDYVVQTIDNMLNEGFTILPPDADLVDEAIRAGQLATDETALFIACHPQHYVRTSDSDGVKS